MHVKIDPSIKINTFSGVPAYAVVKLYGQKPPCRLSFTYEVKTDLTVYLSTRDKLPDEQNY